MRPVSLRSCKGSVAGCSGQCGKWMDFFADPHLRRSWYSQWTKVCARKRTKSTPTTHDSQPTKGWTRGVFVMKRYYTFEIIHREALLMQLRASSKETILRDIGVRAPERTDFCPLTVSPPQIDIKHSKNGDSTLQT
jgi:hypothetical protein